MAEAIERFRDLDRQWPVLRADTKMSELVLMSEYELDGRTVIDQVRQVLADRPDEAAAAAGRLEKELHQLLADRNQLRPTPAEPRTEGSR